MRNINDDPHEFKNIAKAVFIGGDGKLCVAARGRRSFRHAVAADLAATVTNTNDNHLQDLLRAFADLRMKLGIWRSAEPDPRHLQAVAQHLLRLAGEAEGGAK